MGLTNLIDQSWLPIILTGMGTLTALAGTLISSYQQYRLQDELKDKTEQIATLGFLFLASIKMMAP